MNTTTSRRTILKSLFAVGFMSAFPVRLLLMNAHLPKVHLIGIGHFGCQALKHFYNASGTLNQAHSEFTYTFVDDDLVEKHGIPQGVIQYQYVNTSLIKPFANEKILLLAALGEAEAADYLVTTCHAMLKENRPFSVIATLPFRYEGQTKRSRAEASHKTIAQLANCYALDMENIRRDHGSLLFNEAFDRLYTSLGQLIHSAAKGSTLATEFSLPQRDTLPVNSRFS